MTSRPQLIDGKAISKTIAEQVAAATKQLNTALGLTPGLSVILVGEDPASQVYVKSKGRMAETCGFNSTQHTLPADTSEADILALLETMNADNSVHGILVQLPLPKHIDESKVLLAIDPQKDVDGFHPVNVGLLHSGQTSKALVPCTPAGSVLLAKSALGNNLSGKHAVIVGRSNIVGKPAAQLLLQENCTTTIAHSRTHDLPSIVAQGDIVVAAVGIPEMIKGGWLKEGATIIDVGINRIDAPEKGEGKTRLVGDVDFESSLPRAGAITPVPGGVGPMTIAMLMANTYSACVRMNDAQSNHDLSLKV